MTRRRHRGGFLPCEFSPSETYFTGRKSLL
jgi:hypothetical protein